MRFFVIMLLVIPLATVMAAEDEQPELPRAVERLFNSSAADNQKIAEEAVRQIEARNERLKQEVEQRIQRDRTLTEAKKMYDVLVGSGGQTNKQILDGNADKNIKVVATIYQKLDVEMSKTPADYLPTKEEGSGLDLLSSNKPKAMTQRDIIRHIVGAWDVSDGGWSGVWTFRADGTMTENDKDGTYVINLKENRIEVTANNNTNHISLPIEGDVMKGRAWHGREMTIRRK